MAQVAQAAVGASARPWLRVWKVPSSGSSGAGVRWVVVRWLAHPWGRLEVSSTDPSTGAPTRPPIRARCIPQQPPASRHSLHC
jgi:hypothetical protein